MICSKCGKEIKDNAKFCNFCGEKIITFNEVSQSKSDGYQTNGIQKKLLKNKISEKVFKETKIRQKINLQTAILPLDSKSHKRMCAFAIVSLFFIVLSIACSFFKMYINYIDNNMPSTDFFQYFYENATVLDYGSLIVFPAVQIISGVLFLIFCYMSKKRKTGSIIIPSIITVIYLLVWNAILEISVYMGILKNYTVNWHKISFIAFFYILFILVFMGSNNGKIKYSLLAKILTIIFGSMLIVISFDGVYRTFMNITESAATLYGIAYVLLGLASSLFFTFSCLAVQIAMFVCVFSIRRKPEYSEAKKDELVL